MSQTTVQKESHQAVIADLNRETANALALYLNYKKYHWQISGPLFRDLHLLFEEHATQLLASADDLGERARMLGGLAPHHPAQILELATVHLSEAGSQSPRTMVEEALENHMKVIQGMRGAIEAAADAGDPGSADLLTRLIQVHEKQAWYLREVASRRGDPI